MNKFASMCIISLVSLSILGAQGQEYIVKSGDTLYSISRNHKVSVDDLRQNNKLSATAVIKPGQKLLIPNLDNDTKPVVSNPLEAKQEIITVTVQKGDTLYGIAKLHKTSAEAIAKLNGFTLSQAIKVGQVLKIQTIAKQENVVVQDKNQNLVDKQEDKIPEKNTVVANDTANGTLLDQVRLPEKDQKADWPVKGEVFSLGGKFPGVAIKAKKGDAVSNLADGRVIYTGPHSTMGTVVFVQGNNGYVYVYGGNESSLVLNGATLLRGATLGVLGEVPGLTEVQAYFTVWKDGVYLDPVTAPRN